MEDDEKAVELAAAQEVKEDEVRANIITEYGFDEVDDKERIDKLTANEVAHRKAVSTAIGQKIKHRTEAETLRNDPRLKEPKPTEITPTETKTETVDVEKAVAQQLEKRDLDALEYPDDLKKEIQRIATTQGVSIKTALRDPYVAFKIDEYEKEQKAEEATIGRTNRGSSGKKSYDINNPPSSDMSTAEGQKEWEDWKANAK